jgi:hypothetical protein
LGSVCLLQRAVRRLGETGQSGQPDQHGRIRGERNLLARRRIFIFYEKWRYILGFGEAYRKRQTVPRNSRAITRDINQIDLCPYSRPLCQQLHG